jgi:hypothetical protein
MRWLHGAMALIAGSDTAGKKVVKAGVRSPGQFSTRSPLSNKLRIS